MSINRFSFALNASENERYLVRKGVDMLAVLRALASRQGLVTLYFGEADAQLETVLLGVNPAYEELLFSPGNDPETFKRLLEAGSFGVETALDSVRILFIASHAETTRFKGQDALRGRIPDVLARMQRRDSVRISSPRDKPSLCTVPVAANPTKELHLRVEDISIGGLGLALPPGQEALAAGKTYSECSLELPGIGRMRCTLQVVYVKDAPGGGAAQRAGCQFVDLPALSREQVRSYVARLERAQLASG